MPTAGLLLGATGLWITVAAALVADTWRVNNARRAMHTHARVHCLCTACALQMHWFRFICTILQCTRRPEPLYPYKATGTDSQTRFFFE